jgi:hypothetical protein
MQIATSSRVDAGRFVVTRVGLLPLAPEHDASLETPPLDWAAGPVES